MTCDPLPSIKQQIANRAAAGAVEGAPDAGLCTACGAVEVVLNEATGKRDMSWCGESPNYPTGYGCEVCS